MPHLRLGLSDRGGPTHEARSNAHPCQTGQRGCTTTAGCETRWTAVIDHPTS